MIISLGGLLPGRSCTLPNLRLHQAGFAPRHVTMVTRELLPHDLTLTDGFAAAGGMFLLHFP